MSDHIKLTVFTPAYNRAGTLVRTYHSLRKQSCKQFVWLIVDDGSRDHTKELVEEWMKNQNGFEIQYIYKENGGMHTAHNVAYENISTELNVCIDSDDCLATDAIQKILDKWEEVKDKGYAGIIGLDADMHTGEIIGKGFPQEMKETTLSGYYAQGGLGDKKLVYVTKIIKSVPPYPVFENERYVGLNYKYLLIDQKFKMATLNEVLCDVEYQKNGSSNTMWKQYFTNPKGFAFLRTVYMQYPVSKKRLLVDNIHYVSSSILAKNKRFIMESPSKIYTVCMIPFGMILAQITKRKAEKLRQKGV